MSAAHGSYYLPSPSPWPLIMTLGLFTLALGGALTMNDLGVGPWMMLAGAALIIYIMFRWFGQVIGESEGGAYNAQVDGSFRMGMTWFIFSEVMFFAAFFGALFYVRQLAVPIIGAATTPPGPPAARKARPSPPWDPGAYRRGTR